MCGIVGIVDILGTRTVDRELLVKMRDAMTHRGPDEAGNFFSEGIGFGHRRLSIIDLKSGQQPMSNVEKSVTVTFNGEIYNYKELSKELKERGCRFQTDSDTEVILHAWEVWGDLCVERLRGMFAFAIYDKRCNRVFLARDRLGIKPLYYACTSCGFLIFASELKALVPHPGLSGSLNPRAVTNYFTFGYVPQPDSIYEGVHKLEAGHTLQVANNRVQSPKQYWDVPINTQAVNITFEDAKEELIFRLNEAIKIRTIAEVPLGAFLSGGVDSSAIVALMAEQQESPLHTCSIGFESDLFNETTYSRAMAARYRTNHHEKTVSAESCHLVDSIANVYDEPFADSSAIPTLQVCKMAREHVTVALSGDGADELLVGYRRQRLHLNEEVLRSYIPKNIRAATFGNLAKIFPKADWAPKIFRAKTTLMALGEDGVGAYLNTVAMVSGFQRENIFSKSFKSSVDINSGDNLFRSYAEKSPTDDPMLLMQYLDIKTYLVDDILTKVDRASMQHSLEVRVPFIDHQLLGWLVNLPPDFKLSKGHGKIILKQAMESRLPSDILYRPKMGFSVPLSDWLRGPLKRRVQHMTHGEKMADTGIFDMQFLKKLFADHQAGSSDNSTILWALLMFESFLDNSIVH